MSTPRFTHEQRVEAEAAAWMALLQGPDRDASTENGLRRWIDESPAHARAWERATEIWNGIPAGPWIRIRSPRRPSISRLPARLRFALALVLVTIALAGVAKLLPDNGILATGRGEQRTGTLADGTRLELNTDTHIRVRFDANQRRILFDTGEAYFSVTHEHRPFVVVIGDRTVTAVGTSFMIRRDSAARSATVTLIEGSVAISALRDVRIAPPTLEAIPNRVMLHSGQRLRWDHQQPPQIDAPVMENATAWRGGQLIFDHTPLHEALAEFNRYTQTQIVLKAPALRDSPAGGRFRIEDAHSFAQAVAASHHLTLRVVGNDWILE